MSAAVSRRRARAIEPLRVNRVASEASDADTLDALKAEMIDRFGVLPEATARLFDQASLRIELVARGFSRARIGPKSAALDFGPVARFDPLQLVMLVQKAPKLYRLEGQKRLHVHADFSNPAERIERLAPLFKLLPPIAPPESPP